MRTILMCITLCALFISGCVKKDQFGLNYENKILSLGLKGQSGGTIINHELGLVKAMLSLGMNKDSVIVEELSLSTFAKANISVGSLFSVKDSTYKLLVTAENGDSKEYTLILKVDGANPQIEGSDFNTWYTTPKGYQEPGLDQSSTLWATGNGGTVTLGSANVTPLNVSGTDIAAKLLTLDLGNLAGIVSQRMGAGSLFTGKFELDLANPLNSTKFGVKFSGKPKGFSVDYAYLPGSPYLDSKGNTLSNSDSCDIYVFLENRNGSEVKRVATGWFRSGENKSDKFYSINITLTYGTLGPEFPDYWKPVNNLYADSSEPVTHITLVFSSSYNGAKFEGGTNSTLVVNNFKLNY